MTDALECPSCNKTLCKVYQKGNVLTVRCDNCNKKLMAVNTKKTLEQRIKDRIAELESNIPMAGWGIERANEIRLARIDELRKLLS